MRMLLKAFVFIVVGFVGTNQTFSQTATLKSEELEQLVAPIALYPDTLLSQVLIASTYPLEVVEAERWVSGNKSLKGDALKNAVDQKKWDDSVKALTATPDVLAMMSDKLDWMQKLGDAVLAQQPDVMDAIQRLRQKAQANDKLKTTNQQKVSTVQQSGKDYIVIEPAVPQTVYVPYYDPAVVYGGWSYPDYPPYYFPSPGYITSGMLATGIAFATGVAVGAWARGGNWWGGGFNWGNNNININNDIDINKRKNWVHNPEHRQGVRYNNDNVRQKFAKSGVGMGDVGTRDNRMNFRGRDGQQVLKPGDGRPGERPDGARPDRDRPNAGDRPGGGNRPQAKPGKGDRPQAKAGGGNQKKADRSGGGQRPQANPRPSGGAFDGVDRGGGRERAAAQRGHASLGQHGGGRPQMGGGGRGGGGHVAARGGGGRGGFGGGGGRGGGGRRR